MPVKRLSRELICGFGEFAFSSDEEESVASSRGHLGGKNARWPSARSVGSRGSSPGRARGDSSAAAAAAMGLHPNSGGADGASVGDSTYSTFDTNGYPAKRQWRTDADGQEDEGEDEWAAAQEAQLLSQVPRLTPAASGNTAASPESENVICNFGQKYETESEGSSARRKLNEEPHRRSSAATLNDVQAPGRLRIQRAGANYPVHQV